MKQPNHTEQLLMQLNQQRSTGHLCDVIIMVENALFRAHKNVLAACSSYLKCLVLHDNLITLNTEMVKPSVFKNVLDFIYTGQLPTSHHVSNQGVADLLRAASYLQLSDLAAICRRKLKPCRSNKWTISTSSFLTTNVPLEDAHKRHSSSMKIGKSQKQMQDGLRNEGFFSAVSVNSTSAVKINESVETGLNLRLEPTSESDLQQNSPQSSCNSSNDVAFNSTSAFNKPRLEHSEQWHPTTDSHKTAGHKRPQTSRETCLEGSKQTKRREVEGGELVQAEWMVSPEPEDQVEDRVEDFVLKNSLQIREEGRRKSEELTGHKHASYSYHQLLPSIQPALHDTLYMCIPCRRGFPSSEQLIAHVDSHSDQALRTEVVDVEEGKLIKTEDQDSENLPSQFSKERATPDVAVQCHVCSVCSKSYVDVDLLRHHEKSHWLNRPFSCNICGKPFTQRGTMTRHMRSHLKLKPFACEECGMRFTRQYRRTEHMRIHFREKPYECQLCGLKFKQQRSIISHLKMHTVVS